MNEALKTAVRAVLTTTGLFAVISTGGCGGGGSSSRAATPPAGTANQAPIPRITATPDSGTAPLTVNFDASTSSDTDGSITTFGWDFGDSGSAAGISPSHTYASAGTYSVTLQVTDNDGATASANTQIVVTDSTPESFAVSGQIQILGSSAVDADVNDVLSVPNVSNNSANNAQNVPLPVSLGGFANQPGTGPASGRLFASGDTSDFFAISGAGGERVALDVGDHPSADLDLRLWDASNTLVDASIGFNTTETLTLPAAGDYFLEVVAVSGASNYVLSVGLAGSPASATNHRATRLSDNFVAGEWLLAETVAGDTAKAVELRRLTNPTAAIENLQANILAGSRSIYSSGSSKSNGKRTTSAQAANTQPASFPDLPAPNMAPSMALKYATLLRVGQLQRAGADGAAPNLIRRAHLTPNDSLYGAHWHYDAISLPLAWDLTTGSSAVVVAVIDTGVLLNHPDFAGKLVAGYDFISDAARSGDGDGIDDNANDPGDATLAGASSFHGTHVAGIVGAATNNGAGVASSGWDTSIMPLRVLGPEGGTSFDILQAVRYAAGLSNASNTVPAIRADIINLSLGGGMFSQIEQDTFNEVRAAGVLVFASAGNESSSAPSYPAAYGSVVSVSATTISNTLASYSNFGTDIDLAAPGGNSGTDLNGDGIGDGVMSTLGDDSGAGISFEFGVLNGTSMSAPHAAGVAALMKALYPDLSPAEFDTALLAGQLTQDLGPPGRDDQFGVGLLNAQKSVLTALALASGTNVDPGPILTGSANRLNFGGFQTQLELTLSNVGTGDLTVNPATSNQPWLTATAINVNAGGVGTYTLNVDRTGLANGTYNGRVSFTSNSNTHQVDVLMQVATVDLAANAGTHFIILVDETGATASQGFVNTPDQGFYSYSLTNVQPGAYRVFAGTDLDNDDILCDAGEACGAFRTLDSPEVVNLTNNRSDLDFLSGFRQNFGTSAAGSDRGTNQRLSEPTSSYSAGDIELRINKAELNLQK